MVLLVVLVTSTLVPKNVHIIIDPVPLHTSSMPQSRSVVSREVPDGREREPFVAAHRDRQRERGGGGGEESKETKLAKL